MSDATLSIRDAQHINAGRSARWMAGSLGWTILEVAGELAGEVGELANVCKKLRRSELGIPGNKVSDAELMEMARGEAADVFIVLMLVASKLGIDLEAAVCDTFNKKSEQMGFPERILAADPSYDDMTEYGISYGELRRRIEEVQAGHGIPHSKAVRRIRQSIADEQADGTMPENSGTGENGGLLNVAVPGTKLYATVSCPRCGKTRELQTSCVPCVGAVGP